MEAVLKLMEFDERFTPKFLQKNEVKNDSTKYLLD